MPLARSLTRFLPPFFPPPEISSFQGDFNCHHPLWDSRGTSDPRGEEVFDWIISSDLLPLNDHDTLILLHRSSGSLSSAEISFAPSSLAFSCSWEVLHDLSSDHQPILLTVPLSPVSRPNERPPFFNFQKARWDDFPPTMITTVLLQRNARLFLFPLPQLSLPL